MIYGCGAPSRGIFEGKTTGQSIRTRPGFARIANPLIRALSVAAWRGVERGFVSFIVEYGSTGAAVILAFLKMSGNSATACHAGLFRRVCKRCNAAASITVQNGVGAFGATCPGVNVTMKMKNCWARVVAVSAMVFVVSGCLVVRERPHAIVASEGPPPPQVEVVPTAPGPAHVWVGGYWGWHGRWVWEPGHWVLRPHARAVWVPGHWSHGRRGWAWTPGHWR
jgi:hypothetical protein